MAVTRARPYVNSNFLVDFGGGDPRSAPAGFTEVIFPTFALDGPDRSPASTSDGAGEGTGGAANIGNRLILRRGLVGNLDLYAWWNKARRGKAPQRRTVKVELLGEDHASVVFTWRFRNVRPVSLAYSPLRAMDGGIVIETIELAFETVELV